MRIVINADDFGYSADTVRATIEAFDRGLLTSATIMPNMPATADAIAFARERPELSFGVHLILVGDGTERPILEPSSIPHLVDGKGLFPATNAVRGRALLGRLPLAELERELGAQIESIRDAGVQPSHVDSHRHLHKFAAVRRALASVLPRYGIARVRTVQDVYLDRPIGSPTYWLGGHWRRRLRRTFTTTDHFYMPTTAGDRDWHRIASKLRGLPGRSLEIGLHPGNEDEWRRDERRSLDEFVSWATGEGNTLVGWRDIASH